MDEKIVKLFIFIKKLSINFYQKFISFELKSFSIINKAIMVAFLILIVFFYFSRVHSIYNIPINKPYYVGEWDEPFAINAGINALKYNLNPVFFKYGGTAVYPYTIVFGVYKHLTGEDPKHYRFDQAQARPHWPITRKIVPVKPIYITKVLAIIFYLLGCMVFVGLGTIFLLPIAFWPSSLAYNLWFDRSNILAFYSQQMLPTAHQVIFAGITAIFFIKAILEKENKSKFLWLVLCTVFASSTVAIQLNSAYIIFLPLSLILEQIIQGAIKNKKDYIMLGLAILLPYLIINPASWLSSPDYRKWLWEMLNNAKTVNGAWEQRIPYILEFIKDISLLSSLPAVAIILLVIASIYLFIKTNVYAFCGFTIFYLYSFYKIVNMSEQMFQRHLAFLLIPTALFIIFPLIYLYQRASKNIKLLVSALLLSFTLITYPYVGVIGGIRTLVKGDFASSWTRDSRDDFSDYVLKKKLRVYFYDFHNFSMPNTINNNLSLFVDLKDVPSRLKSNEYIGMILYASSNRYEYNDMTQRLLKQYTIVKTFGQTKGAYDINDESPLTNPSIILLK